MPRHDYQAGDACYLDAIIERSGPAIPQAALVVLLDAGTGSYWFYPTWREYPPELDYETITVAAGRSQFTIIPEFTWPAGAGSSDGFNLAFFGAILDSSVTALVSNLDSWTFEYR